MLKYETQAAHKGYRFVIGVDEAGRGPLAGPVVAGAVLLPPQVSLDGLDDSKKLSQKTREKFFSRITRTALAYGVGIVSVETIDRINILQAALLAMKQAIEKCNLYPDLLLIDGNQRVDHPADQWTIVRDKSLAKVSVHDILPVLTTSKEPWMYGTSSYNVVQRLPSGQWLAFLRGTSARGLPTVGFARSKDGRTWDYFPENPVLKGPPGEAKPIVRSGFIGYYDLYEDEGTKHFAGQRL
ncbi:MAG: hypothetical protein IID17_06765, partial [Nitrospinae bacterium]|nr:hypothetical protein [Nitrospinota bacterium]